MRRIVFYPSLGEASWLRYALCEDKCLRMIASMLGKVIRIDHATQNNYRIQLGHLVESCLTGTIRKWVPKSFPQCPSIHEDGIQPVFSRKAATISEHIDSANIFADICELDSQTALGASTNIFNA